MASSETGIPQERLLDRPSDDDPARTRSVRQQREAAQTGYSRGRGVDDGDASSAGRDLERQAGIALIPTTHANSSGPDDFSSVNSTEGEPTGLQPSPSAWSGHAKSLWQLAKLYLFNMYFGPLLFDRAISEKAWNLLAMDVRGAVCGLFGAVLLQALKRALRTTSWGWVKDSDAVMKRLVVNSFGSSTRMVRDVVTFALPLVAFFYVLLEWGFRGVVTVGLAETTSLSTAAITLVSPVLCGAFLSGSLSSFIRFTWVSVFMQSLLLLTGNILVPIVAHTVQNVVEIVQVHLKVTQPPQRVVLDD